MANFNIDYLVVAGGGGGNYGGGGAGGYLTNVGGSAKVFNTSAVYTVTVGAGGSIPTPNGNYPAGPGGQSIISESGTDFAITDGGGGGASAGAGGGGGSGSGGGYSNSIGGVATGVGIGNNGGVGNSSCYGGGGGGAGETGDSATNGGNGGDGLENNITGTPTYYAGGGGSIRDVSCSGTPQGGLGGGGNGGTTTSGVAGTNGLGGGGGARTTGGSGIVILRYATADVASYTATGLTPTQTTNGTDTILSFTTVGTGTITFTPPPPPTPFDGTRATTPVTGFNKTGTSEGLKLPSGDNSNQPVGALAEQGMIRNDTEETVDSSASAIAHYNGTNWQYFAATESVDNPLVASQNFNTVIYTGNGADKTITDVGFQPDLVWVKSTGTAHNVLFDSVRGAGKRLISNLTIAEDTGDNYGVVSSFDPTGFTTDVQTNISNGNIGRNGVDYAAWCFKAGGLINKAAYFNGSSSIVKSTNLGAAFNNQTTLSIAGWFKTSTSTSRMTIASFSNTAVGSTDLWIGLYANENTIAFRNSVEGASGLLQVNDTGGSNLRDGNWHHVVFTADSNGTHVYVDGSQLTGYTYSFGNSSTNIQMPSINQFSIGANQDSSASGGQWFMNGIINQVRVFTSALSASQATELYNETVAENSVLNFPNGAGCIAAYPLSENANGVDGLYNGSSSNVTFGKPGYLTRNTEGTIESTVSTNVAAGFSIVKWSGDGSSATIGHGLDTPPELTIKKNLDYSADWAVNTYDRGGHYTYLNKTNAELSSSQSVNSTTFTASGNTYNRNGTDLIAYCFHSVDGYSKIGSYLGNGSTTGPIIDLGFEPAWLMFKCVTQAGNWIIIDNKRATSNPRTPHLRANSNAQDDTGANEYVDFTSNGFQPKGVSNYNNNSNNQTYIYMAFATS